MKPLIVLDRDGVINEDSEAYIKSPDEFCFIPGNLEAIVKLKQAGFTVVIATNQSGVARGFFTEKTLQRIHNKLITSLKKFNTSLDGIFYCPHHPDDRCDCRKPKPGLFYQVCKQFHCKGDELLCVGDSLRDLQAANQAGCQSLVLVKTGNGQRMLDQHRDHPLIQHAHTCTNLADFVALFLANPNQFY